MLVAVDDMFIQSSISAFKTCQKPCKVLHTEVNSSLTTEKENIYKHSIVRINTDKGYMMFSIISRFKIRFGNIAKIITGDQFTD